MKNYDVKILGFKRYNDNESVHDHMGDLCVSINDFLRVDCINIFKYDDDDTYYLSFNAGVSDTIQYYWFDLPKLPIELREIITEKFIEFVKAHPDVKDVPKKCTFYNKKAFERMISIIPSYGKGCVNCKQFNL